MFLIFRVDEKLDRKKRAMSIVFKVTYSKQMVHLNVFGFSFNFRSTIIILTVLKNIPLCTHDKCSICRIFALTLHVVRYTIKENSHDFQI